MIVPPGVTQPAPLWTADPLTFGVRMPLTEARQFAEGLAGLTDWTKQVTDTVQQTWDEVTGGGSQPGTIPTNGFLIVGLAVGALFLFSAFSQGGGRR